LSVIGKKRTCDNGILSVQISGILTLRPPARDINCLAGGSENPGSPYSVLVLIGHRNHGIVYLDVVNIITFFHVEKGAVDGRQYSLTGRRCTGGDSLVPGSYPYLQPPGSGICFSDIYRLVRVEQPCPGRLQNYPRGNILNVPFNLCQRLFDL